MAIEIERKFLVNDLSWKTDGVKSLRFKQGYIRTLPAPKKVSVRIRIEGDRSFITLKGPPTRFSRSEFQYEVPLADAEKMLEEFTSFGQVEKIRYFIPDPPYTWEIDEYLGENAGLITAEIELPSETAEFNRPQWLGKEVSGVARYYNSALASRPWSQWSDEEKA